MNLTVSPKTSSFLNLTPEQLANMSLTVSPKTSSFLNLTPDEEEGLGENKENEKDEGEE